jgi:hypothetical protein
MCLWDPEIRQFEQGLAAHTNLYCAGLALLGDGHLLAVGGHAGKEDDQFLGLRSAEVFDPWSKRWSRLPDMAGGKRWYPTAVTLPGGRALVASGVHAGTCNDAIELFDPAGEAWEVVARQSLPIYPWAAVRLGGRLLLYGPQARTMQFEWGSDTFRAVGTMSQAQWGEPGALLDGKSGPLLAVGGGSPPVPTTEGFDPGRRAWQSAPSMTSSRRNLDLVLLSDGGILAVGGSRRAHDHGDGHREHDGGDAHDVQMAEILGPDRSDWKPVGRSQYGHGYHSTALFLPDGSVLTAGPERAMEIYHPWYTTVEYRPEITGLPRRLGYGGSVSVSTPGAAAINRVVLIRAGSVTHSLNTDQRFLTLEFEPVFEPDAGCNKLSVQEPPSPGAAPPGYYLLFVVNNVSVPSEGQLVRVGGDASA